MLERIAAQRANLPSHSMSFFGGVPVVYHCHHFNLFWDQTIDDALGSDLGTIVRTRAAREAYYDLLSTVCKNLGLDTAREKLAIAKTIFAAMGHGRLDFEVDRDGGGAIGEFLHYGYAWSEKYGRQIRRRRPADAVAAGYTAAATEIAHGLARESVDAQERECLAMRDRRCTFTLRPGEQTPLLTPVRQAEVERALRAPITGKHEDSVQAIANSLREFAQGISGDERGLVEAFGLFMSLQASTYYNRSGYDAFRHIARNAPQSVGVMKALLRESGHVCAFNTFGGILLSPEWEGMVGPLKGDIEEVMIGSAAIARALGFGHWCIEDFEPGRHFVLRTPGSYESVYYANREGRASEGMCFFLQGAAVAIMQLSHHVPWTSRPELTQDFYTELFRSGLPWQVEETQCASRGDSMCEFVVTRSEARTPGRLNVG